jgi:NADH:ubiquinone oxidoreductase subunit C
LHPDALREALNEQLVPGSLSDGDRRSARGFDVEAELPADKLPAVAELYREAGYFLECLTAVDREDFRELWYQFNRFGAEPDRHLLRVLAPEDRVPTIAGVLRGASWHEREAFDMMGVVFEGAPTRPRLLLPEGSDFHPLRRDQCIDEELRERREKQRNMREAKRAKEAAPAAKAAGDVTAGAKPEPATPAPPPTGGDGEAR